MNIAEKATVDSVLRPVLGLACLLCFLFSTIQANAASSAWQDLGGGKARLIAVEDPQSGMVSGAIEVKLEPGWKTYWRTPGDSGIPPQFDFSGSSGFVAGDVAFPAPYRIAIGDIVFAGYKERVLFPFTGRRIGSSGGSIDLKLFIGVCEEICIPAQAVFQLPFSTLQQNSFVDTALVTEASIGLPAQADTKVTVHSLVAHPVSRTVEVKLSVPKGAYSWEGDADAAHLFVEGGNGTWFEPVTAKHVSGQNGSRVLYFDIPFDPAAKTALADEELTMTLRLGDQSVEFIAKTSE